MTRKQTRALGIAAALAAAGTLAWAQPLGRGDGDGPGPMGHRLGRMAEYLDLNDDQREQARSLFEQARPARQQAWERMREQRARLDELLSGAQPDPVAVGEAAIALHQLREQQRADREAMEGAFEALLTPEQLRKWEVLEATRLTRGGPHRGRRGPRRGWGADDRE